MTVPEPDPTATVEAKTRETRSDFTVIVPAFNEEPVIRDLVRELRDAFERLRLDGEVIVVDDGSTDGTGDAALEEAGEWTNLVVARHLTNQGKTEAIVTAAKRAKGDLLVIFDADLQHSPNDIPRFLDKLDEGWDIVTAERSAATASRSSPRSITGSRVGSSRCPSRT